MYAEDLSSVGLRNAVFHVGDWLVHPRANRIERDDEVKTLRNKAMELLVLLAERPGQVVLREEIIESIWEGNEYVAMKGITNTMWTLRQVLGDIAETPVYIETIAKRGYRLIATVSVIPVPDTYVDSNFSADEIQLTAATKEIEQIVTCVAPPEPEMAAIATPIKKPLLRQVGLFAAVIAVITMMVLLWWPSKAPPMLPVSGSAQIKPIFTSADVEFPAVISPDGQQLAYVIRRPEPAPSTLTVRGLQADDVSIEIKQYPHFVQAIAWSPEGSRLVVLGRAEDGKCHVEILQLSNITANDLGSCADDFRGMVAWSPDGNTIALTDVSENNQLEVVLVTVADGKRTPLTHPPAGKNDFVGDFSPDGQSLLLVRHFSPSHVQLIQVDKGGSESKIWETTEHLLQPGIDWWDDKSMLFAITADGIESQLHALSLADGKLTALGLSGYDPQYLPDGSVHYVRSRVQHALSKIELGNNPLRVEPVVRTSGISVHSRFQNRDRFVFASNATGYQEIYQGDMAGNVTQLTNLNLHASDPALSADGKWLAFAGACGVDTRANLCIMDMASHNVAVVVTGDEAVMSPIWLSDNRRLLFRMNKGNVIRVGIVDKESRKIEWLENMDSKRVVPSADGNTVYWVDRVAPGLRRRDLASGSEVVLIPDLPMNSRTWDVVGNDVYFLKRDTEQQLGVFHKPANEAPRLLGRIGKLAMDSTAGVTVSPDGAVVLLTEYTTLSLDPAIARSIAPSQGGSE